MEEVFPIFHVFINHRGHDVKKSLASLIYHALKRLGLRVFLDEHELQTGDSLSPAIISAIRSSSVHIAIFSETYAESTWCLNELLWMSDCDHGRKIIPIFYGIQPSDLRYIDKGYYATAFHNHRNRGRVQAQELERWTNALIKVSNISGLVFCKDKDDLGEFLDRIVDVVIKEVRTEPLDVAIHPVGLHRAAEHFNNEVFDQSELSEHTTIVGIVGLGGSGKTTLVKHLYNSKRSEFRRSCFLSGVSKTSLPCLQQELLNDLLGYHNLHIENTSKGRRLLRDRLRGSPRVLIVFDDIDDAEQIENLLVVKDVVGNGSLILITSRDRDLLVRSQINILYDVKLLDLKDAQELFCWHAFHQSESLQGFQDLVEELVYICAGFPLALKVLGAQLCGNHERSYWMRQLKNFQTRMPDNIVQKVLRVSYDSLNSKEKEAFLDIAHFLVGEDKDLAVRVLEGLIDGSGVDCLDTLRQKCLVEFENADVEILLQHPMHESRSGEWFYLESPSPPKESKQTRIKPPPKGSYFNIEGWRRPKGSFKIKMHDLVRNLARQIGREECPLRLFLSCAKDTGISTELQSKPCSIRGIRKDEDDEKLHLPVFLQHQDICGLKFLLLPHSISLLQVSGLSGDLIWLRLPNFNCNDISCTGLSLRSLRVLELTGINFQDLGSLSDDVEPPSQLHELTITCIENHQRLISHSSQELPSSSRLEYRSPMQSSLPLGSSPQTQIQGWSGMQSVLNSFQAWFGKLNLKHLVKIALNNIKAMQSLPIKFEELKNLRHLDLSGCSDLEVLPNAFTELLQLEYLALRDCRKLLLLDLGRISRLEYLDFEGCSLLSELPRGTIVQRSLRYLNLLRTRLERMPEHLQQLENLEQLHIGSPALRVLPSSLTNLHRLTDLTLFGCPCLFDIGKSIKQLLHLERLRIYASGMEALPEAIAWMNIKVVDIQHCPIDCFQIQGNVDQGADRFPRLDLKAAHHNNVSCLTNLIIKHSCITKVYIPPEKCLFPNLENVKLSNNPDLRVIEGLPGNLLRLNLMHCPELKTLICLSNLTCLKYLNISGCYRLETLDLKGLCSIEYLNISGCNRLETLNVEGLRSTEVVKADKCWNLQSIQGLAQLQKLAYFHISTSNSVSSSIWRNIMMFPSNISTGVLCGATAMIGDVNEMERVAVAHNFQNVTVTDISQLALSSSTFPVELKGAILLCLIADEHCEFKVTLLGHTYTTSCLHHIRGKYGVHVLMWTKDSEVFRDLNFPSDGAVYCQIELLNPIFPNKGLEKGWMVDAQNSEVCKQFLNSLFLI
ncbi:hypothetical protein KI387_035942 [Taxus chinensis]|uniref:TIR domain-containing protein n=1 Tax=Taxus chinensis TaxID=29808 RepID=A0AA38KQJ5_TAXCH|nr:hypothetical protein KI387_035942 [Taxus chinensis]